MPLFVCMNKISAMNKILKMIRMPLLTINQNIQHFSINLKKNEVPPGKKTGQYDIIIRINPIQIYRTTSHI